MADEHERRVTEAGNPARPEGALGQEMLERMNRSHADVTNWALDHLSFRPDWRVLDVGCGGGATMGRLGRRMELAAGDGRPGTWHVTGVDYSPTSCEASRAHNAADIAAGRMDVVEASVEDLPFADASFDVVTTVESFYFWPSPRESLGEVLRVLGPGGRFLLVADVYLHEGLGAEARANIERYDLTVLAPDQYRELLLSAGFSSVDVHLREGTDWICVEGVR